MIFFMTSNNEFLVYSPLTRKSVKDFTQTSTDDGRILLEGIASTTNKDLTGEVVSPEALKSMAQQAKGVNIHGDHHYGLNDVIGAVKEVIQEPDNFRVKFLVTRKHTPAVKDLLETGVNLGLSIGGFVHDYDHRTKTIKNINLNEISLTPMPANMDTFGTVHEDNGLTKSNCLTGACYHIIKSLEENNMTDNNQQQDNKNETEEKQQSENLTRENAIDLFNELMASEKQAIVDDITEDIKSGLEDMVKSTVNDMLSESEDNKEEDAEDESAKVDESLKSIADTLSKQIDTKFEEIHKGLFKTLEVDRQPESHVTKELHATSEEENNTTASSNGFTTKSIAEKLANTDSRTQLINKIRQ